MRIIGVDFSGAQDEKKSATWLAQGRLEGGILTLETCHPIIRSDLTAKLQALNEPATVAMDFPFSVPREFAPCLQSGAKEMPDLWDAASKTNWGNFKLRVCKFGGRSKKPGERKWPIRKCDQGLPAQSPLKPKGNPAMLPMTFRGMGMLHSIWSDAKCTGKALWIQPLPPCQTEAKYHTTLMEVMPGATVHHLVGKNYYRGYKSPKNRGETLTKLSQKAGHLGLELTDLSVSLDQTCRANDDALDAVVAAITAALWCIGVPAKIDPADCPESVLEGWMYVPQRANR